VWIVPIAAVAATGTGVALLLAASGLSATPSWALLQNVVVALAPTLLSVPLLRRASGRRIGLLLLLGGSATALGLLAGGWAAAGWPGAGVAAWLGRWLWAVTVVPMTTVLFAVFPDGRAPTPRWRPVVWLGWAVTAAVAVQDAGRLAALTPVTSAMWVVAGVGGLAALGARWRTARGVARQQVKYLVLAGLLVLVLYAVADLLPYHLRQAAFLAVPLLLLGGVALAVLRYRLYDVDLVIRRTAVFVGVTGLVFLAYLTVAAAFGTDPSERAALVAAVVVAVVAESARRRLQRATGRLLFGRRDEPLTALALLRDRLRDATDDAELAAAVTEVVPPLLRTRAVALHLFRDGELREVARTGEPGDDAEEFPLVHQSELLGTLTVGLREPGVAFGRADRVLLAELSHPVAAAAHAVRLQAELRAAADRVLRAAAAERERFRRELHDRLGPLLVAPAWPSTRCAAAWRRTPGPGPGWPRWPTSCAVPPARCAGSSTSCSRRCCSSSASPPPFGSTSTGSPRCRACRPSSWTTAALSTTDTVRCRRASRRPPTSCSWRQSRTSSGTPAPRGSSSASSSAPGCWRSRSSTTASG
jgi:two-component system, NarL family, sensor kinase